MEKQVLPNSTLILVLGIISIVGCCCYGLPGLICGIIAIILGVKSTKIYKANPDDYSGYGNVQAGKIMGIIATILSLLFILLIVWAVSVFGWEALQNEQLLQERIRDLQGA